MRSGRDFAAGDGGSGEPVVLVNDRLVALHFPGQDVIGRRVALRAADDTTPPRWQTIVGVVPDIRQRTTSPAALPIVYAPIAGAAPATAVAMLRTPGGAGALASSVRSALAAIDTSVPLDAMRSLAEARRYFTWANRISERFAFAVTFSSFVLATVGLYAVVATRTALRRREIGLRMALGASPREVVWLVLGSVRGALAIGLALGLLGVTAWDRAFAPARAGARLIAPTTLGAAVATLAVVIVLACALPARRAARLAPADVLRRDG